MDPWESKMTRIGDPKGPESPKGLKGAAEKSWGDDTTHTDVPAHPAVALPALSRLSRGSPAAL